MGKIVVSGGTGLIGRLLTKNLLRDGYEVVVLSRRSGTISTGIDFRQVHWDGKSLGAWKDELEGAEAVVSLAGENIGAGLWTKARKDRILQSRLDSGYALVSAIKECKNKPGLFIQASAIGIYGTSETEEFCEGSPPGNDYLANIGKQWEESTKPVELMDVKRAIIRTGIVLDLHEGALSKVMLPFRLFVGGRLGSGRQWFSWIHPQDEVDAIIQIIKTKAVGVFNLTAPRPIRNSDLAKIIGKLLHRPNWFPIPAFALRLILGEMSTLVLEGQKVLPNRLLDSGYQFHFGNFEDALRDLLSRQ